MPLSNMQQANRVKYTNRMNKVIDYIDKHLGTPIDLQILASVAHFSEFHFHRIFSAWMGETLGMYVQRRRLETGALLLSHHPGKTVLEVALEVGFGSSEAFARAFKLRFGLTPTVWRIETPSRWAKSLSKYQDTVTKRNLNQLSSKMCQASNRKNTDHADFNKPETIMKVEIVNLSPARVAYMRHIGPYGPCVSQFWQEKFLPWRFAHGLENASCYGIGHDDPDITPPDKCRYDACVEVPEDFVADNPVSIANLPGGRYAVAHFQGDGPAIGAAWNQLLREWLPSSGMQPDARPFFELYTSDDSHDIETGVFTCRLCIPVKPL